ncbi:hypothetical protein GE061_007688 [Apolygus lucorum]|uniref:Protein kinase domain-containing protein n=1 Tax=Apolygus lucorum TaxID=248454 RepID=A0A8S9WR92_APOLU|nr:hypothetical protein GE061_007688 [Apolygus lucorum]
MEATPGEKASGDGVEISLAPVDSSEDADAGVLRDKTNDAGRKEAKEAAKKNRRRKKTTASLGPTCFQDMYRLTGEVLGSGAYASVQTCVSTLTDMEFAVKVIEKTPAHPRARVFREVETFHHCQGQPNIIQLLEMFEDEKYYYLVFEKVVGGQLLTRIQERKRFTEREAAEVTRDLATALKFLHKKGIAHRDLKPENILCVSRSSLSPVKLCDLDLGSGVRFSPVGPLSTPRLNSPVGSAEFMAPEVVDVFVSDCPTASYDKRCDMWSLGVVVYILLSGYPPFWGRSCQEDPRNGPCIGADCPLCRVSLFQEICDGKVVFDELEWCAVSDLAKDLIYRLLRVDPEERLMAEEVLCHPWVVKMCAAETSNLLDTPNVINKNNSASELSSMADSAMTLNRVLVQQLSLCDPQPTGACPDLSLSSVQSSTLLQRRTTKAV